MDTKMDTKIDNKKLSNKERIELFQSSVTKLTSEMDVGSVRDLLRQRFLKAKEEEEQKKRKQQEEEAERLQAKRNAEENNNNKSNSNNNKNIGKQLARIFRFKNASRRQTVAQDNLRNRNRPEVDPFDDPNVLFENFGFHNDLAEMDGDVEAILDDDETVDGDEINDEDSCASLIRMYWQRLTFADVATFFAKLMFYVGGQAIAYRWGFGAPFFAVALLVFICTNLRKKRPGELSAYSVFNPGFAPIPSVASSDQPQNNIVLGFGNL